MVSPFLPMPQAACRHEVTSGTTQLDCKPGWAFASRSAAMKKIGAGGENDRSGECDGLGQPGVARLVRARQDGDEVGLAVAEFDFGAGRQDARQARNAQSSLLQARIHATQDIGEDPGGGKQRIGIIGVKISCRRAPARRAHSKIWGLLEDEAVEVLAGLDVRELLAVGAGRVLPLGATLPLRAPGGLVVLANTSSTGTAGTIPMTTVVHDPKRRLPSPAGM